jgi:hypothetical protein
VQHPASARLERNRERYERTRRGMSPTAATRVPHGRTEAGRRARPHTGTSVARTATSSVGARLAYARSRPWHVRC